MSAHPDMSSPDDSVILAQLRSDTAAWEREATKHHPERAALYATIALAKWLHDVARRADVAGLVERARWCAIRLSRLNADSDIGREAQSDHDAAVLALARLAGGGA